MHLPEHACYQKGKLLTFTGSQYTSKVVHELWILWKQKCFLMSSGTLINSEQWINNLLTAILLPSKIDIIQIEAHTKRSESEYEENIQAHFHAKVAATQSVKTLVHVVKVQSTSVETDPLLPHFWNLNVVTWQQSAPESEKLRWIKNGCKLNNPGYGKSKIVFVSFHFLGKP